MSIEIGTVHDPKSLAENIYSHNYVYIPFLIMQGNCRQSWWHFNFCVHTIMFFSPAHQCIVKLIASFMALANHHTQSLYYQYYTVHTLRSIQVVKNTVHFRLAC